MYYYKIFPSPPLHGERIIKYNKNMTHFLNGSASAASIVDKARTLRNPNFS